MTKFLVVTISLIISLGFCVTAKEPQQPNSYAYGRGVEAYSNEDYSDAHTWFTRELSENPKNGYASLYLAALNYKIDEYGSALSAIESAIRNLPKKDTKWRSISYATRAEINKELGDTVTSLKDMAEAIKLDPKNSDLYKTRAQTYYELEDYSLSDADYRMMISLDPGDVVGYMGIGRNANAQKKWNEAITQFNYVTKLAPDYSNVYSFRADSFIGLEKWNEATDDIIKALDIDGDQKAFILMTNLPDDASDLIKSKLKIQQAKQRTNRYWPYCIATLAFSKEDYAEAADYFKQANQLDANSLLLKKIAQSYLNLHNYSEALDYVGQAFSLNPEEEGLTDLKADIYQRMGKLDESIIEHTKCIAEDPENPFAYWSRADVLMDAGRYEEALADYNISAVIFPLFNHLPAYLIKRGDAYRLTGKTANAEADYNAILEEEKESDLSSGSWTPFAYSGLKNKDKAVETMRCIVTNDTKDPAGNLYNLACIYARTGDNAAAVRTLNEAIEQGYKEFQHIKYDYDLQCLKNDPEYIKLVKYIDSLENELIKAEEAENYTYERVEVPFTKENGITKVKCSINDLPLHFVFDTGAADVTLSMVEANFMLKNDYIKPDDFVGSARYVDANGDISEGSVINLRNVNFGGLELDNVRASVVRNQKAPLLLGQSVLGRLGKIEIDNTNQKLIVTHRIKK